jgi:hypothetical protein
MLWCIREYVDKETELKDGRKSSYKDTVILDKHLSFKEAKELVKKNKDKKIDIFPDIPMTQEELDIENNKIEIIVPKANPINSD